MRQGLQILLLLLATACGQDPVVRGFAGPTMGSSYEVKYVANVDPKVVRKLVEEQLRAFDRAFSNWRSDSEIARVNAHQSTEPLAVSPLFADVLTQALVLAKASEGAFDPTAKPLSDLFRAAKDDPDVGLTSEALEQAQKRVGYTLVKVVDGKLIKQRDDVLLDLDGLVAGAAADAIGAVLLSNGVDSFYVQITGEVLCRGTKPKGEPWRIGVVDPESDVRGGNEPVRTLALRDRALCSSGDYRNSVVVDDRLFHHLFDPRTGRNPEHGTRSASVLAESCAVADALGTALMVLGGEEAKRLWPKLQAVGAQGALLLKPGADGWQQTEITWPSEDS